MMQLRALPVAGGVSPNIGFIGGGMMATALIGGFLKSGAVASPGAVCVSEPVKALRDRHAAAGHFATDNNISVVERSDIVWLATKPDAIPAVLAECGATLQKRNCLVVSIAAGMTTGTMEGALPPGVRVIRVMPNLNALVNEVAAGFCCGTHATRADAETVKRMLGTVGRAEEVPEKLMDAVTGLSGSGPAYGFLLIEALADGGVRAGLPRATAMILAAQTIKGAAEMVLATGKHPGELKDQVCSPGGTTIAGVEALEKAGFRAALIAAVTAAAARSAELGKPASKL
jgi:pyrroline-5-carboxylate reductase